MASRPERHPWAVHSAKVEAAVRKIIDISRPVKLILFGSYVRGETNINSRRKQEQPESLSEIIFHEGESLGCATLRVLRRKAACAAEQEIGHFTLF